jgi:hypothetical protein
MEINIVGAITDDDTLDEIQKIAKIFVYEQHMKKFDYPEKNEKQILPKSTIGYSNYKNHTRKIPRYYLNLQVKGLC